MEKFLKKKTCPVLSRFEATPNQEVQEEIIELGDDVLAEIILRLPLDSVARSKCVSKHWSAAVADDYLRRRLPLHISMLCFPDNDDDLNASNGGKPVFYAGGGNDGGTLDPLDDLGSFFPTYETSVLCDATNGLLLCRSPDSSLHVISPVTKRFTSLPKPSKNAMLSVLAFDPLSSSSASSCYHVVNFTGWREHGAAVEVYSSATRAWSAHEAGFGAVPSAGLSGTMHCHGGKLFVLASGGPGPGPACLVGIDLAGAKAQDELACAVIALPEGEASDGRVASSGGRIHYVCGDEDGRLKVWVLEDEGSAQQWRLKHAVRVAVNGDEDVMGEEEVRFLAMHPEKEAVVYLWTPWKVVEYDLGKRELTGAAWELGKRRKNRPVKTWLVPAACYLSDVLFLGCTGLCNKEIRGSREANCIDLNKPDCKDPKTAFRYSF